MTQFYACRRDVVCWCAAALAAVAVHATMAALIVGWSQPFKPGDVAGAIVVELAPIEASPEILPQKIAPGPHQVESQASEASAGQAASKPSQAQEKSIQSNLDHPQPEPPQPPEPEKPAESSIPLPIAKPPGKNALPENTTAPKKLPEREKTLKTVKPLKRSAIKSSARKTRIKSRSAAGTSGATPRRASASAPATTRPHHAPRKARVATAPTLGHRKPSQRSVQTWKGRLVAHIERRKRYPAAARRGRQQGTAYLAFSIDRRGRLLSSRVTRSSGFAALDREALALARRAQPFPPPPAGVPGSRIRLVLPIRFHVR